MNNWLSLHQHLLALKHRQLVLLIGDDSWAQAELNKQLKECAFSENKVAVYDEKKLFMKSQRVVVDNKNYRHYLGAEFQQFIYIGDDIIPDVFAAMAGTVVAGGLIILVINSLPIASESVSNKLIGNHSTNKDSLYARRFYQLLIEDNNVEIVRQYGKLSPELTTYENLSKVSNDKLNTEDNAYKVSSPLRYHSITKDQEIAVEAIAHVVTGHRNRPVVLTADRGRGKSATLALACIHLIKKQQQSLNIVIVAPKLTALHSFFSQFSSFLPEAAINKSSVSYQDSTINFLPIDVVLAQKPLVNLLIIDEAASIPLYLLAQLFSVYHRLVFSSTLHGYEGAGRGFAIKFDSILKNQKQQANYINLTVPIRWAENDPVEQTIFDTCLLNAELPLIKGDINDYSALTYSILNKATLLNNEMLLRDVFAILVTAHYQTTPNDLKQILDNPAISLMVLMCKQKPIAVALIIKEGDLEKSVVDEIKQGKRRVKDHFIPQALLNHTGFSNAFDFSYWRIMRIAVHPKMQQQGIGQYFLTQIEQSAKKNSIDVLAASFALNENLFDFWQKQAWKTARIGFQTDHASGEYSALQLKALNNESTMFCDQVVAQFYRSFAFLLTNHFDKLTAVLVYKIFSAMPDICKPALSDFDLKTINDFAQGYRLFDNCSYSLFLWIQNTCSCFYNPQLLPLIARLLQKHTVEQVCLEYNLSGKKALQLECQKLVKAITQNIK